MANTSIWRIKKQFKKTVRYAEDKKKTTNPNFYKNNTDISPLTDFNIKVKKTELECFVSGVNCFPYTAYDEMQIVKERFGKTDGTLGYHGYQSFAKGEVSPEVAHEIGVQLANNIWSKYQVIVSTHLNKEHIHNHFVLNTVSFVDGIKYNRKPKDYRIMRNESDRLCKEHNLSVIDTPKSKGKHYAQWQAEKEKKPNYHTMMKNDIDEAIVNSMTESQFFSNIKKMGYDIKRGQDITLRASGRDRGIKLVRGFGEEYSIENIRRRILSQTRPNTPLSNNQIKTHRRLQGTHKKRRKLTGFRALYFYYLYKLGKLPTKKSKTYRKSPKQINYIYRSDLIKLHQISNEAIFLCKNNIDTKEQLLLISNSKKIKIEGLTKERNHLRYKSRSISDEKELQNTKNDISILSKEISMLRKDVKLCDGIKERSENIKTNILSEKKNTKKERKEKNRNESFR